MSNPRQSLMNFLETELLGAKVDRIEIRWSVGAEEQVPGIYEHTRRLKSVYRDGHVISVFWLDSELHGDKPFMRVHMVGERNATFDIMPWEVS